MQITNEQINDKYESGKNRFLRINDRIKISELVDKIRNNPDYMIPW